MRLPSFLFLLLLQREGVPQTCHEGERALDYLSTKRSYHFTPREHEHYTPEGCEASKIYYFGRHGTRWPGTEDIDAMQTIIPDLFKEILASNASSLPPQSKAYFQTWTPNPGLSPDRESHLTTQGIHEITQIAKRYVSRYPTLFPRSFSNATYSFRSTKSQRTEASARAFASAIFNSTESVYFPPPLAKDPVLKFYSLCSKWIAEVDDSPAGSAEHDSFVAGGYMNATISRVSTRLGLGRNLTLAELTIMYTTCAFETAWANGTLSQWCVPFSLDDLAVMAYAEDLEYYYKDGYGFAINGDQACPPFADAIRFFKEAPQSVRVSFSHSGATLKMLAHLSLFNRTEIRADNFEQVKQSYDWRTSRIDTMASNMALVLFQCASTSPQVAFLFQEHVTPLPACDNAHFCPWDLFKQKISATRCDLNQICEN